MLTHSIIFGFQISNSWYITNEPSKELKGYIQAHKNKFRNLICKSGLPCWFQIFTVLSTEQETIQMTPF